MPGLWIAITVAILFPLFGVAVFFYWRRQYGVGSTRLAALRAQREREELARAEIISSEDFSSTHSTKTDAQQTKSDV